MLGHFWIHIIVFLDNWTCSIGDGACLLERSLWLAVQQEKLKWTKQANNKVKRAHKTNIFRISYYESICVKRDWCENGFMGSPSSSSFPFLMMNTDYCHLLVRRVILSLAGAECASWLCSSANVWLQQSNFITDVVLVCLGLYNIFFMNLKKCGHY